MKAYAINEFGGTDKIQLMEFETPTINDNEVLIENYYVAVNPVDWKIREGLLKERLPHQFPLILGWDASGKIAEVGKNITQFKKGDEVYAYCRKETVQWGTYAEYIALDVASVALKPKTLKLAEAAAIPLVGLTAWQALFDVAHLTQGETILIHAGAGGVGSLAIQFAKYVGAEVITTASQQNHDYVIKLGADLALDYTLDFVSETKNLYPEGIDVIFDCVGGRTARASIPLLKPGGRYVSIVEKLSEEEAKKHSITSSYVFVRPNGNQLTEIAKLIDQGKVKVPNIIELPFGEVVKSHEMSQTQHVNGKIVLKIK